jgi:hypothetical protein
MNCSTGEGDGCARLKVVNPSVCDRHGDAVTRTRVARDAAYKHKK